MSKKLIAVASAAALALTALVATPASASYGLASVTIFTTGTAATGAASAPIGVTVPDDNSLDLASAGTTGDLIRVSVAVTRAQKVTVAASGGVRLIDQPTDGTNKYTAASGATSWTKTADDVASPAVIVFYVYSTSTSAGSFTVTVGDSGSATYSVKGVNDTVANSGYKITDVKLPSSATVGGKVAVSAVVLDAFGNQVTDGTLALSALGSGTGTPATPTLSYSSTTKRHEGSFTAGSTAGQIAVSLEFTLNAKFTDDVKAAFGTPVVSFFGITTTASLEAQLAALQAQVASLEAKVAAKVTKKRYNRLAKRWNAQNPNNKVKLKK